MEEHGKYAKRLQPRHIVTCPHCSYQYLPAEVLYPDQILGVPELNSIIRDPLGHIIYEAYDDESEPLAEDTFICENCEKPFIIEIETKFKSRPQEPELDFSNTQVQLW